MPEKIVTAYQAVLDEHFSEDTALNKCKSAARLVEKMEKDVDEAWAEGMNSSLRPFYFLMNFHYHMLDHLSHFKPPLSKETYTIFLARYIICIFMYTCTHVSTCIVRFNTFIGSFTFSWKARISQNNLCCW